MVTNSAGLDRTFGALADVLQFTYDQDTDPGNGDICGPGLAGAGGFTTANGNRGCLLGVAPANGALIFTARVVFPYANSDQNLYADAALAMNSVVTGYTQP